MIYIIILNYNGWQDTIECLNSLVEIKGHDYKVIVIDNFSTDNSLNQLLKWSSNQFRKYTVKNIKSVQYEFGILHAQYDFHNDMYNSHLKELSIIQSKENNGYSAGNNVGIRYALQKSDTEYIWILNNDTVVNNSSLDGMLELFFNARNNNIKLGIVGLKLLYYDDPTIIQCLGGGIYNPYLGTIKQVGNGDESSLMSQADTKRKIDYVSGASMLVTKEFIDDVGLLEESYFLYFEELDWATRGKRKGWNLDYTLESSILHKEGSSIGGTRNSNKSKLADYCFLRSKILYTRKFENIFCLLLLYMLVWVSLFLRIVRGQYDRIPTMLNIVFNPNSKNFMLKL